MGIYREEKVNIITIAICWLNIFILTISLHLNRNSNNDSIAMLASGILYLIPSIMFYLDKKNKYIKYAIIGCSMFINYINLYVQGGIFDNIFYIYTIVVLTAVYFQPKITVYTTATCMVSSSILYFGFRSYFFPAFKLDNYICLQLVLLIIGLIISIQTYWSNKLVQSQKELYNKAIRDKLTLLYNRTFFDEYFSDTVYEYKRDSGNLSIIVVDVDDFKNINDTFGHTKGDIVLKTIAQKMQQACRKNDIAARIGGEEFIILLKDTVKEEAISIAERLRKSIEEIEIEDINVTISLGITCLKEDDTVELFFSRGDKALYKAKHSGKNCFIVDDDL